ncbi:hypothetical protein KA005_52575, partial [bacterium]|nr:hypothetical protein [bacterium]
TLTCAMFPTPASAQIASIWRKLEKEVETFLIFAFIFLRFKKAISYHPLLLVKVCYFRVNNE